METAYIARISACKWDIRHTLPRHRKERGDDHVDAAGIRHRIEGHRADKENSALRHKVRVCQHNGGEQFYDAEDEQGKLAPFPKKRKAVRKSFKVG